MELTFIGHQSWLISQGNTHILLDPILADRFGSNDGIEIFPPRTVRLEKLPPVSAVFLSHEHSDHVHFPSLSKLDRSVPILVGSNMVHSMVEALESMGFEVTRCMAFKAITVGELAVTPFPAGLETVFWECRVNQLLISPVTEPERSVFIAIDALVSKEYLAELASARLAPPVAVLLSNNSQITPPGVFGALDNLSAPSESKNGLVGLSILQALLIDYMQGMNDCRHIIICGGGFMKGYPDLGPFPFSDQAELAAAANCLTASPTVHGPRPGDCYAIARDVSRRRTADFIEADLERRRHLEEASGRHGQRQNNKPNSLGLMRLTTPIATPDRALEQVADALQRMAPALMMSPLGQRMVVSAQRGLTSEHCILVALILDDGREAHYVLDVLSARFEYEGTHQNLCFSERWRRSPFGIVTHLCDFHAVITGDLQIWDIAGVALHAWYEGPAEESPVAFLYSWLGEQLAPRAARRGYARAIARSVLEGVHE